MTTSALTKKLQIKPNTRVLVLGAPDGFAASLDPLPDGVTIATAARGQFDVVHLFVRAAKELEKNAPKAIGAVREGGVLWTSYPKKSSKIDTDLTRDEGWKAIEGAGWGGVAQVSIDETWSALRFKPEATVARKANSAAAPGAMKGAAAKKKGPKSEIAPPEDLAQALAKSDAARALWATMAPSHRKEYVGWIEEAKRADTRARRVDKAVEMMAAGVKNMNEKYVQRSRGGA
jgi:Bacteriocin-protection, YdeI or OmpD-Associated